MTYMKPFGYLNYPGEQDLQLGRKMGPNVFGEMFVVIEQDYDPNTNMTRLGLVLERMVENEGA